MISVLGIDIGGVIIDKTNDQTDTSFFSDNFLKTTASPHVFEVLATLVERRFGHNTHIVSKCGRKVQEKSLLWLAHHDFYRRTGIPEGNVHFCRERSEKAPICEKLGVTHFIDDKLEVLSYLTTVKNKYLFQTHPKEVRRYQCFLGKVYQVNSWPEFLHLL